MKIVNLKNFGLLMLGALAFVSCDKDTQIDDSPIAENGDAISFFAKTTDDDPSFVETKSDKKKVKYSGDDAVDGKWQLEWEGGENIALSVVDENKTTQTGSYSILKDAPAGKSNMNPTSGTKSLTWGVGVHNFYGVFPSNDTNRYKEIKDSIATFVAQREQYLNVPSNIGVETEMTGVEMKNLYLACHESMSKSNMVNLTFKPAVTTLKIVVNGPSDTNQKFRVTSLTVTVPGGMKYVNEDNTYKYNIKSGKLESVSTSTDDFVVFCGIDKQELDIPGGKSVVFTVFLPPFDIKADNPIKVRVNALESKIATKTIKSDITPKSRFKINLPKAPGTPGTNDWLKDIDDDVYLSQLSIPGAVYSFYGDYKNPGGYSPVPYAYLDKQWDWGFRVFDFRGIGKGADVTKNLIATEGSSSFQNGTNNLKSSLKFLENKLAEEKNKKEFVVLFIRREQTNYPDGFNSAVDNAIAEGKKRHPDYYNVNFSADLTVGDLRRKILIIYADWFGNNSRPNNVHAWVQKANWDSNQGTSAFPYQPNINQAVTFNSDYSKASLLGLNGNNVPFAVHDFENFGYNFGADNQSNYKWPLVKAAMQNHANVSQTRNVFTLTHACGYAYKNDNTDNWASAAGNLTGGIGLNQWVAAYVKSEKKPVGFVLFSFPGMDSWKDKMDYPTAGWLIPGLITDINFKQNLRKKPSKN